MWWFGGSRSFHSQRPIVHARGGIVHSPGRVLNGRLSGCAPGVHGHGIERACCLLHILAICTPGLPTARIDGVGESRMSVGEVDPGTQCTVFGHETDPYALGACRWPPPKLISRSEPARTTMRGMDDQRVGATFRALGSSASGGRKMSRAPPGCHAAQCLESSAGTSTPSLCGQRVRSRPFSTSGSNFCRDGVAATSTGCSMHDIRPSTNRSPVPSGAACRIGSLRPRCRSRSGASAA